MDQWASVVGRGVRSPCSDSDESDDDVLSVGPMRPLLYAALLGGAIGHDDYKIQDDSLHDDVNCGMTSGQWIHGQRGTAMGQVVRSWIILIG